MFQTDFCAPENRRFVLIVAILASALGFIDGTVVAIALPAMRDSLDAGLAEAQWIHNAYMLTLSALILVGGAAGDKFGLARVLGIGVVLFVAASVFCAIATTPRFMILARGVQGLGAAIMVPGSLAIIARAYPREDRGRAIGIWAAASALTTALGPIIGGLALSLGGAETWRWIFAINVPLGGLALWLLITRIGVDRARPETAIDVPGAVIATAALLALAWGLTATGAHDGAGSPNVGWIALGLAGLMLFVLVELRQSQPMVPMSLFASRVFSVTNLMSFVLYSALSMMFFFMPMTFIAGWGVSELEVAATFAPMAVFISVLSSRAGRLADRVGLAPLLAGGSITVAAGYAAMGLLAPLQNFWGHIIPAMCLVGLGMAFVVAPLSTAVMSSVDEERSGAASGINNAVTRMAGLISVAAAGSVVALLYARAGGEASFGLQSDTAGHGTAMTAAFSGLAYLAGGLALMSAILALGTRTRHRAS